MAYPLICILAEHWMLFRKSFPLMLSVVWERDNSTKDLITVSTILSQNTGTIFAFVFPPNIRIPKDSQNCLQLIQNVHCEYCIYPSLATLNWAMDVPLCYDAPLIFTRDPIRTQILFVLKNCKSEIVVKFIYHFHAHHKINSLLFGLSMSFSSVFAVFIYVL